MAKIERTGDTAIEPLRKTLMAMCGRTGYTPDAVFEGLLDFTIGYLNPSLTPEPVEGWKFKPDDLPTFYEMLKQVCECYKAEIPRRGWYDPFGDLYMAIHSGGGGKGQFFTPPSVAQVVAEANIAGWDEPTGEDTPFGHRITIADCAAGSGRMPLAGYTVILRKMQTEWGYTPVQAEARRPYICCEDLDYNCVKMSAINLAFHGCFGECICHDTLAEPDKVRLGYIINETMYPFPTDIPSIRKEMNPLRFTATRLWTIKKQQYDKGRNDSEIHAADSRHRGDTERDAGELLGKGGAGRNQVSVRQPHQAPETADERGRTEKPVPQQLTLW